MRFARFRARRSPIFLRPGPGIGRQKVCPRRNYRANRGGDRKEALSGAGWGTAAISGRIWAAIVVSRFASEGWAHKTIPLVTPSKRGVSFRSHGWLLRWSSDRLMLSISARRASRVGHRRLPASGYGACRDSGTDARPNAATRGGRFAERLAERGARDEPPGRESAAPALPGGGLGSLRGSIARWRQGIDSDLSTTVARF